MESYIVNQVFCNDRSLNYGNGYNSTITLYSSLSRAYAKSPSLMCINQNDRFTLKENSLSTIKGVGSYGNNALEYPVGLITADEVMLAGGLYNVMNSKYYINTGYGMWISSPADDLVFRSSVIFVSSTGVINYTDLYKNIAVRPVINLKSDIAVISGSGTANDPYILF